MTAKKRLLRVIHGKESFTTASGFTGELVGGQLILDRESQRRLARENLERICGGKATKH